MGQEIDRAGFAEEDFRDFAERLELETGRLCEMLSAGLFSAEGPRVGFELEAWLIDHNCFPAPHNQSFLMRLADSLVVAELSRFNIEVNGRPQTLAGDGLLQLERELEGTWARCAAAAHEGIDTVLAIGTLPTLRESDLSLENMTPANRYVALNREAIRLRGGAELEIDIDCAVPHGRHLKTRHLDVMLEAATTSFQLHLQVPAGDFAARYNAALMLSAPLVAISANSPFLFGRPLWHETRIPIFEQAVEPVSRGLARPSLQRVTFGNGYLGEDPAALFAENLADYAVLLPDAGAASSEEFPCLRLHNGTIWRWNRPLVGFDADGTPHLRIEHRVMPSGPTIVDMMANAALFYGAVHMLAKRCREPEALLPFAQARGSFYAAAKHGLGAEIDWIGGRRMPVREVLAEVIAFAREGLAEQGVEPAAVERYLDLIAVRLATGRNGAEWQLAHHARHGDLFRLTADYLERQRSGMPVHEWPL